jgi:hypothetical protein
LKVLARGLLLALGVISACDSPDAGPAALVVELGTGETAFEPLRDGATLPLVAGPQGGHHVWLGFRVAGLASDRAELTVEPIPLATGELPPRSAPVRVFLTPTPDGGHVFFGWPAQLADVGCLVGERLLLRVTLADAEGAQGSDARTVVVGDGLNVPPCPE